MIRLALRLLAARLRRNRTSSLVVVLVLATAGASGASAVLLHGATSRPWDRAFAATHGAHVHVASFGTVDAGALARLPGVVESSGPVVTSIRGRVALTAVPDDLRVDRPAVIEGGWRAGAVVLERSFARALGLGVGDRLDVGGTPLVVSGIAVSVATPGYPARVPGSAYADPATVERLGATDQRLTTVGLRVADPSEAPAVAEAASRYGAVTTAAEIRAEALDRTRQFQVVLGSFAVILLAASGFLVAVLLGARLRAERRELALYRLMGLTPAQLVGLVAAEHAVLAAAGGVLGAGAALAGAGRLADAAATALGSTSPRPGLSVLAVVGALVVAAAGIAAAASRRPGGEPTSRPSAAARRALAAGLPAPVALAAKEITSAPARAASTVLAVALAVTTAVAALGMEATFRHSAPSPDESGLRALVYGLQALLALVAVTSIVAVGLVGLRERRRELAVLSAVGFSAGQLGASVVAGQCALAGAGAVLGVPLGIGFFRLAYALANGSSAGLVDAPPAHLLAVVPVVVVLAAMVAAVPASALRRLPVAAALRPV